MENTYKQLEEELQAVIKAIRAESNWVLPVLYTACTELKNAAIRADGESESNEHLQSVGRKLNAAFSSLLDRKPGNASKKRGAMKVRRKQ